MNSVSFIVIMLGVFFTHEVRGTVLPGSMGETHAPGSASPTTFQPAQPHSGAPDNVKRGHAQQSTPQTPDLKMLHMPRALNASSITPQPTQPQAGAPDNVKRGHAQQSTPQTPDLKMPHMPRALNASSITPQPTQPQAGAPDNVKRGHAQQSTPQTPDLKMLHMPRALNASSISLQPTQPPHGAPTEPHTGAPDNVKRGQTFPQMPRLKMTNMKPRAFSQPSPSGLARRRVQAMAVDPDSEEAKCPAPLTACSINSHGSEKASAKTSSWECLNLKEELSSCGKCGNDCQSLPHVDSVGCQEGSCKIFSCAPGYKRTMVMDPSSGTMSDACA
ncbi:hypothetical protein PCASD_10594 [Puccinia coronata f. sp. avenae]|uniref:Protein CPL1-like domain-containing protein n=1 Tax=Puccinia coronata f. sp. avenae TaxID=200324 RepID=A0A2N5U9D6_9BASI|nr:hypothetical protein PCASD_10594 [Puccinia coronata f. sp. avenae]